MSWAARFPSGHAGRPARQNHRHQPTSANSGLWTPLAKNTRAWYLLQTGSQSPAPEPLIACFMIMSCPGESSGEIKRHHPIAMRLRLCKIWAGRCQDQKKCKWHVVPDKRSNRYTFPSVCWDVAGLNPKLPQRSETDICNRPTRWHTGIHMVTLGYRCLDPVKPKLRSHACLVTLRANFWMCNMYCL